MLFKKLMKLFCPELSCDPLPYEILCLMIEWLVSSSDNLKWLSAACLALAFDCYLRPTEAVTLDKVCVCPPAKLANERNNIFKKYF